MWLALKRKTVHDIVSDWRLKDPKNILAVLFRMTLNVYIAVIVY